MIEYRRDAIDDTRLRSALSDCAGTIIYSRRRKVFLEAHRVAAASRRVSYRVLLRWVVKKLAAAFRRK